MFIMRTTRMELFLLLGLMVWASAEDGPEKDQRWPAWLPFQIKFPKPPPQVEQFFSQIPIQARNLLDAVVPKQIRDFFDKNIESIATNEQREKSFNATTGLDTDENFFVGILSGFKEHVKAIYPGTQWCGDGSLAKTQEELGLFWQADRCCRQHDSCPEWLGNNEERHGLKNTGLFTRSHCDCDTALYNCLKKVSDPVSVQIGTAYFTVLGPQCFRKEKLILGCVERAGLTGRCVRYDYETESNDTVYQWFDNPEF